MGCGFVFGGFFIVVAFVGFVGYTVTGISEEVSFHHRYGADWQQYFEQKNGPVLKARQKIVATGFGSVALPSLAIWLYKQVRKGPHGANAKKKLTERRMSNTERVMRARSRAFLWNALGLLGLATGALLMFFRLHILADRSSEVILGMFILCAGYCGVMSGCWWWLKAKAWPDAAIAIGAAPLIALFIPFVRLIFIRAPVLMFASMVMMATILFVVVAVLPDKSGVGRKQRRPMNWKNIGEKREL